MSPLKPILVSRPAANCTSPWPVKVPGATAPLAKVGEVAPATL
jgi:hypothetical protein